MSSQVEFSWLIEGLTLKEALQKTLGSSGQLIKKHFSSKEQSRPVKRKEVVRLPLGLVNHMQINPVYEGPEVKILAETDDYIALHKPPFVHSHPHDYDDKNTLLNYLVAHNKWEALNVNKDSYDRGLLYRLDYETSGVIVLAKKERFLKEIRGNFDSAMKRKFYWAIVDGEFDKDGRWAHYFKSTGHKGVMQKVSDHETDESRVGTLSVIKISSNQGKSLVLVNLKTGLRHQIRAQLSYLGFPILGDELYGGQKAQRLYLHALRYEFTDTVEDPTPELFHLLFDLDGALQMSHDMLARF